MVILSGILLWPSKPPRNLSTRTTVIPTKSSDDTTPLIKKEELSPSILFEKSDNETVPAPRFILQATEGSRALITINSEPYQWFHTGDKIIGHYTLHSIDRTLVTIFDGKGAYYEITLDDAPLEEISKDNETGKIQKASNQTRVNRGEPIVPEDGQRTSYDDGNISDNTGAQTFDQATQTVDTFAQTIIYGDKDISQQLKSEQDQNSKYVQ